MKEFIFQQRVDYLRHTNLNDTVKFNKINKSQMRLKRMFKHRKLPRKMFMEQLQPSRSVLQNFSAEICFCILHFWLKPLKVFRSSHRRCSVEKGVLGNFAKFTERHLCQCLFFNKVEGLRPATSLKKETLAQVFSYEFCGIFKETYF